MTQIRTVNLEILRAGPPNNQLLSPLTSYLGICGNYGAASVNVPYEHAEFLSRLKTLRYQDPAIKLTRQFNNKTMENEAIAMQYDRIRETAESMADILQKIPGLVSELNEGPNDDNVMTHLRLVISHAELALLPFELAKVPIGCKGGRGSWLSLQTISPVCITRQVRGVSSKNVCWSQAPRILFAFAATENMQELIQAHTTALTQSILPWLHYFNKNNTNDMLKEIDKHLSVLPNATIDSIANACENNHFTHVHILAHGAHDTNRPGNHYGINLRNRKNNNAANEAFETISGERLASVLCTLHAPCPGTDFDSVSSNRKRMDNHRSPPLCVTIASCDSGNQSDVIYDGASFAQDLHQAGIPFVVASQFPLSFAGSKIMTEVLYNKLMCGVDPRLAIHTLRSKLSTLQEPGIHDWAALVVYAALPDDIDSQLVKYRYQRAHAAINASLSHVDAYIDINSKLDDENKDSFDFFNFHSLIKKVDEATNRLPMNADYLTEAMGLLGTINKRKAEAFFRIAQQKTTDKINSEKHLKKCLLLLKKAHQHYLDAANETLRSSNTILRKKRELHWPLTQYLSLSVILDGQLDEKLWQAALLSTEIEKKSNSESNRVWAKWSELELHFLKNVISTNKQVSHESSKKVEKLIKKMSQDAHRFEFQTYSSRRQLSRYEKWWGDDLFINNSSEQSRLILKKLAKFAKKLIKSLPEIDT